MEELALAHIQAQSIINRLYHEIEMTKFKSFIT